MKTIILWVNYVLDNFFKEKNSYFHIKTLSIKSDVLSILDNIRQMIPVFCTSFFSP